MVSLGEVRCELSHVNNACSSSCMLTIFLGFSLGDVDHWISCMSVEVLQKEKIVFGSADLVHVSPVLFDSV